jgi:uncharacterized membrane protein YebE (DUF533 family)
MKSNPMKKAFGVLALGVLGLMATAAHANWDGAQANRDRDGYGQGHGRHAYQQSQIFGQQINARLDRQMQRIRAGQRAGHLTRFEFRELMQEQHKIRAMEQHFREDGVIDAREFRRLDHALDRADRNIRAEKHDRQAYGQKPWY